MFVGVCDSGSEQAQRDFVVRGRPWSPATVRTACKQSASNSTRVEELVLGHVESRRWWAARLGSTTRWTVRPPGASGRRLTASVRVDLTERTPHATAHLPTDPAGKSKCCAGTAGYPAGSSNGARPTAAGGGTWRPALGGSTGLASSAGRGRCPRGQRRQSWSVEWRTRD